MDKGLIVAPVAMVGILGMIYANNKRGNKPDIDTSNANILRSNFGNKDADIVDGFGDLKILPSLQTQPSVRFGGKTKYNKRKRHQNKTKRKSI